MKQTLFLLPGLLCDEQVWAHQVQHLSALVDIRIPDFSRFDSLDAMADAVLQQAPEKFLLAGHSMGGRVALQILHKAPERISKLALLDTGTHSVKPGEAEKRQVLIDLAEKEGMAALARTWTPPMVHPARHDDATLMEAIHAMVQRYDLQGFRNQIKALLGRPDALPFLAQAPAGTLVLCGREDMWSPPAQHEVIARALPDQPPVTIIDNSGHMAPMEQPEAVSVALRSWLCA
jgi:pimeloyl-ACP methyl ester carboxylesterase